MAGRIVVGVDGSELGKAALRFAAEEATLRDATLVAVHAWSFVPPAPLAEPGMVPVPMPQLADELDAGREGAEAVLAEAVEAALGRDPGVRVEQVLAEGSAGDVLVAQSATADLVVVGSHGRSAIAAALLGSVSGHVAHHASCPVVIVRA